MLYAQVGHHHLARTTETSPERSSGHLSCLSARPHDLADAAITRPRVVGVLLSIVPCVYSKRAVAARSLVSRYRRSSVLWPLRAYQPWNYPVAHNRVLSARSTFDCGLTGHSAAQAGAWGQGEGIEACRVAYCVRALGVYFIILLLHICGARPMGRHTAHMDMPIMVDGAS